MFDISGLNWNFKKIIVKMKKENKKIKVAFVSIFSYPLFNPRCDLTFGGAEVQISLISKELAKDDDFDVSVVVADTGQKEIEVYDNVSVYRSYKRGRNMGNLLKAPVRLYKTLKKVNPDIVVCRAAGVEVGIASIYAKMDRKKFVYSIASNGDISGMYSKGIRGKLFEIGFKNADKYVAQSAEQMEMLGTKNKALIKNSFPPRDLKENSKSEILWIGRGAEIKRPDFFLKLARDFPGESFVMIMPKSEEDPWERILQEAKNIQNLKFIESVPFGEIDRYFDT